MRYDILLKNCKVVNIPSTKTSDILINNGIIEKIAAEIDVDARFAIDLDGLVVSPGLIDSHCHLFYRDYEDLNTLNCIIPDHHLFASGVTTAVDAGTAGWGNFNEFREHVIDKSRVRIFAYVNIAKDGMIDLNGENEPDNFDIRKCADCIIENDDVAVGVKSAHYWTTKPFDSSHPMWASVDSAISAGDLSNKRVMVDFYPNLPLRTYPDMLKRLRSGDIHTHMYAQQFDVIDGYGRVSDFIMEARERGVLFDVGHGACSFWFRNAIPSIAQGHTPNTISSDLYGDNISGPVFSLLHVMNKFINIGLSVNDVFEMVTSRAAALIGHPELGLVREGGCADISVFRLKNGPCRFSDGGGACIDGNRYLESVLTIRAGQIVYNPECLGLVSLSEAPSEYFISPGKIIY